MRQLTEKNEKTIILILRRWYVLKRTFTDVSTNYTTEKNREFPLEKVYDENDWILD